VIRPLDGGIHQFIQHRRTARMRGNDRTTWLLLRRRLLLSTRALRRLRNG
jgi:hypothetical protein